MYVSLNWVIIGSGNGLLPIRHQAITYTNAALLSIGLFFSENWTKFFIWENAFENVVCQNGDQFVQGEMS